MEDCVCSKPSQPDKGNVIDDQWKHRSAGMKCSTCMWFVEKVRVRRVGDIVIGRCRRHCPTMSGFPVVYETDWCGDHRLDEDKI